MSLPEVPARINVEFLEKVLRKSTNDKSVKIKSVATKYATGKGDNYLSDIIRAAVEYTYDNSGRTVTKNVSLIIKLALTTGDTKKTIMESGAFDTEIKVMETTLKKMNNMLKEEKSRLSSSVLYTENGEAALLVLEDLGALGYQLTDRQAGLDLEHCLHVMRKLGMFHATSVALWEKDPQLMTSYTKGLFKSGSEDIEKLFSDAMKVLGEQVLHWQELGTSGRRYSEKILKLSKNCIARAEKLAQPKDGAFNVLVHGDLWVNNMLFRYKDGKVDDLIFVDFQMCSWSSPGIDMVHFLNTSPTEDVEVHNIDALLEEYLNVLTKTMSKLGCRTKPITMTELKRNIKECEYVGLLVAAFGLPLILPDKSKALTLEQLTQMGESYVSPIFQSPTFRRRMLRRLIAWNSIGIFDV